MAGKEFRPDNMFQDVGLKLVDLGGVIEDVNCGVGGLNSDVASAISGMRKGFVDAGRGNANANASVKVHVNPGGRAQQA